MVAAWFTATLFGFDAGLWLAVWIPGHAYRFCITPIPHCRATVFWGCQGGKDALTTPKNC